MQCDVTQFFDEYAQLISGLDKALAGIHAQYPDEVRCKPGCSECCFALFDLSLIEAMALNEHFHQTLDQAAKDAVLERAERADREIHRIKHRAFKSQQKGVETDTILRQVGQSRVRCPLLDSDDTCVLYPYRPATCRVYGLPLSVNGEVHICAHTGFEPGRKYPAIHLDTLNDRLMDISRRMVEVMPTKYDRLAEVLVPVSMALLTEYDDDYLGLVTQQGNQPGNASEWTLGTPDAR